MVPVGVTVKNSLKVIIFAGGIGAVTTGVTFAVTFAVTLGVATGVGTAVGTGVGTGVATIVGTSVGVGVAAGACWEVHPANRIPINRTTRTTINFFMHVFLLSLYIRIFYYSTGFSPLQEHLRFFKAVL